MDLAGNVCNIHYEGSEDMSDFPVLYYTNMYSIGVCVSECPAVEAGIDAGGASIGVSGFYPGETEGLTAITVADYSEETGFDLCDVTAEAGVTNPCDWRKAMVEVAAETDGYMVRGGSAGLGYGFPVLDTYRFMNRCILTSNAAIQLEASFNAAMQTSDEDSGFLEKLQSDLYTAQGWILGFGFVVAMFVSFFYTFFLRLPGVLFIMIWGCIAAVFGMFFGIGGYGIYTHGLWTATESSCTDGTSTDQATCEADGSQATWVTVCVNEECNDGHTATEADTLLYISYAFMGVAAIWFVLICFLRARIQLALEIVKQAAKAIRAMPMMIVFPLMQCIAFVIFMVVWMLYAVHVASLGKADVTGVCNDGISFTETICNTAGNVWIPYQTFTYGVTEDGVDLEQAGWYLLFCYFWTSQFIIAIGQIVIAMCVAKWYFARDKSTIGNLTVTSSIKDSMYYHTGTAAFGSLLIAIIKMIRAAIAYAQKKAKESGSKTAQAVLCALQCYMWCMEKCMKFLNKNAYIQTAIFGKNFCMAAKAAFFLILRNIARIGACTLVSEFVIIIGKVFICVITGGLCYFAIGSGDVDLNSPLGPVFFVMILSYFTAAMFMNIFAMGISTILQCFVADEEMFDASSRFAESELASFIDANGAPPKAEKKEDNTL
ncbi:hypothetical protein TeGR_g8471 [Tetraparma gracilis]|uniref:Choline transporter-like protein n=2 Tax=Tetraparma gracilis TaxID=2962635 RepID=A0ABQ6M682_9STRA|nr:hypothetical protein TeGR_g8471 [Tetraparma gracilis]